MNNLDHRELQKSIINIELKRIGVDLKVLSADLDFQGDLALFETGMRSSYKIQNVAEAIDVLKSIETGSIEDNNIDSGLHVELWKQIFALVD